MKKVIIGPSTFAEKDAAPIETLKSKGFEIVENPYRRKLTKNELLELLPGAVAIIAGLEPLDREVMAAGTLKVISRCGSGMSNVDLKAAEELGIAVRNTPTAPVTAVAELTMGCLLALLRNIHTMNSSLHKREWNKIIGHQLCEMDVAVIGFGNIGQKVSSLLLSFGARVSAVDPQFSGTVNQVPIIPLEDALRNSDIITLHCSGEEEILGEREFEMMKEGLFLLNAARGSLINEKALRIGLDRGRIAGAWLDTFQSEPYNGELCTYSQVILTPHIGSYTEECRKTMEMEAVNNLMDALGDMQ